jgi:hypothetical protein
MAENIEIFTPKISPTSAPEVAPTKRMGTTIPPLPPKFKVTLVKTTFKRRHTKLPWILEWRPEWSPGLGLSIAWRRAELIGLE